MLFIILGVDCVRNITRLIINEYNMKKIDFMGYSFTKNNASYHHLIIPRRLNGPETIENGAVLNGLTSHPYLHIIESKDLEIFNLITSEMIDENIKGRIDVENIKRIHDLLIYFEKEHDHDTTKKKKLLIKRQYVEGRVSIDKLR